jgi:hypothetical protein
VELGTPFKFFQEISHFQTVDYLLYKTIDMKIKKNGKIITLTEGDLQRIVKRILREQDTKDSKNLWIDLIDKLGKDKFTMKTQTGEKELSDRSVLTIGVSPSGFGISIKLPQGVTESKLTKELLKFGDGGYMKEDGLYKWSEFNSENLDEVYKILSKYL